MREQKRCMYVTVVCMNKGYYRTLWNVGAYICKHLFVKLDGM